MTFKVIGSPVSWRNKFLQTINRYAQDDTTVMNVDCGSCSSCCTGFHIFVSPDEREGLEIDDGGCLKRDANDTCTYLKEGKCSVYDKRPRACRSFTCQPMVFAGVASEDDPEFNKALAQWRFVLKTDEDVALMCAIQYAKDDIIANIEKLPDSMKNGCAIAGLAVVEAWKFLPYVKDALQNTKATGDYDELVMAILSKQGEFFNNPGNGEKVYLEKA